jgi:hypothetical protein
MEDRKIIAAAIAVVIAAILLAFGLLKARADEERTRDVGILYDEKYMYPEDVPDKDDPLPSNLGAGTQADFFSGPLEGKAFTAGFDRGYSQTYYFLPGGQVRCFTYRDGQPESVMDGVYGIVQTGDGENINLSFADFDTAGMDRGNRSMGYVYKDGTVYLDGTAYGETDPADLIIEE